MKKFSRKYFGPGGRARQEKDCTRSSTSAEHSAEQERRPAPENKSKFDVDLGWRRCVDTSYPPPTSFYLQGDRPVLPGEGLNTWDITDARVCAGDSLGKEMPETAAFALPRSPFARPSTPKMQRQKYSKLDRTYASLKHTVTGATPSKRAPRAMPTSLPRNTHLNTPPDKDDRDSFHKRRALVDGRSPPTATTYMSPLSDRLVETDSRMRH